MSKRIVVATDATRSSLGALRLARRLAEDADAEVEVLAIYEPADLYAAGYRDLPGSSPPQIASIRIEALRNRVRQQLADVGGTASGWPVVIQVRRVAPAIARFAGGRRADLVLVGLRQPEPVERWLGREALLRLVHLSHVPVLAVPPTVTGRPRQVVVAIDFSDFSQRAAHQVLAWIAPGARVHLAHVAWSPPQGEGEIEDMPSVQTYRAGVEQQLEGLAAELEQAGDVETRTHLLTGDPGREILRLADEIGAELIATGSHGAGFFSRIVMGSVSSKVAHGTRCALFVTPPEDPSQELLELDEGEVMGELGTAGELATHPAPATAE
jgi:nucleotide-binding universal stress UspA family protein